MDSRIQLTGAVRRLLPVAAAGGLAVTLAACGGIGTAITAAKSAASSAAAAAKSAEASAAAAAPSAAQSAAAGAGAGSAGGGAGTGTPDPCQVVTSAEASQLAGAPLKQAHDIYNTKVVRSCLYAGSGLASVAVTTARVPGVTAANAQAYYSQAVQQFSGEPGVTLSDPHIADKSLAGSASAGSVHMKAVAFLKGQVYVSIVTLSGASLPSVESLATVAAGRV